MVSNVISLVGLTLVRFALADTWIWAKARPSDSPPGPYGYDIHGIVSVLSDARLPELERFRVGSLAAEPDIRVRLGRVAANGDGPAIRYREGAARLWTVDPDGRADRGDGLAAGGSISSRPVHERGRADPALDVRRARLRARPRRLPRGGRRRVPGHRAGRTRARRPRACGSSTARPYSFLSDDLTLLSPDGRVLTYPKPLTISRHTLKAVKTPLLTRRERRDCVVQSRLHSRSGRRFALILARTHAPGGDDQRDRPAARPAAEVPRRAARAGRAGRARGPAGGMVVIQRGGIGGLVLDEHEALETLMRTARTPTASRPTREIEHFLHSHEAPTCRDAERATSPGRSRRSRRAHAQRDRWTGRRVGACSARPSSPSDRRLRAIRGAAAVPRRPRTRRRGRAPPRASPARPGALRAGGVRAVAADHVPRTSPATWAALAAVLVVAASCLWDLQALGFNSDEAVYAGQAAAIADDPVADELFPVFRAHPLLFQTLLSLGVWAATSPRAFERFAAPRWASRPSTSSTAGQASLRAQRRGCWRRC